VVPQLDENDQFYGEGRSPKDKEPFQLRRVILDPRGGQVLIGIGAGSHHFADRIAYSSGGKKIPTDE